MKVDEVMTPEAVFCRSTDTLAHAAQLMWDHDCGCVPVVDEDRRVVGMITDRDACMAALHSGRPLRDLPVSQAMASQPVTVGPRDRIEEAQDIMRRARVRRLPVTDIEGRLVGILSLHDLARAATRERRWLFGVKLREVAKTFAEVSRPWDRPALPEARPGVAYAE